MVLVGALLRGAPAPAQLAITEVMSATRANPVTGFRGPDYWELTHFGTRDLDLTGWGFRDSDPGHLPVREPFSNLVLRPGQSVIFLHVPDASGAVTTPAEFRAWWGETNLPPDFPCRTYRSPGLSGWDGDAIWLYDASNRVVDSVQFGRARVGRAFTYDRATGLFGALSTAGVDGAFAAAKSEDVGSPGRTIGPVPVCVLQEPADQEGDAGMTVTFTVVAGGLPRPRCQWLAQGRPIVEGVGPTLVLSNVQPAAAGSYQAVLDNGLSVATSAVATLTVNTLPTPPRIVIAPADATVFERQTAVFTVAARGYPAPQYEWWSNGVSLANATGPRLEVANVTAAYSGTRYAVRVSNAQGATNAAAWLVVARRPDLRFTEVMARPAHEEENRHFDWFELTNFETNAVNLVGWRFSDSLSFARAVTISNDLTLRPGESAVFAERLDGPRFAAWWGAERLPDGLQVFTYSGFGLGNLGDTLFLWNPAALDPYDTVAVASWAAATEGVSLECEHACDPEGIFCMDEGTTASVLGQRGAFQAVDGGDLGSPGYVNAPPLRILSTRVENGNGLELTARVCAGKTYRWIASSSLGSPVWTPLVVQTATNNVLTTTLPDPQAGAGFYRLEEVR